MPRRKPCGFSLIEMLVVVVVIGLLAALLLPGLSRARSLARATECASNLRQVGIASAVYAVDFDDKLPYFRDWLYTGRNIGDLSTGTLFPYVRTKAIYVCATDKREMDQKGGVRDSITAPSGFVIRTAKRDYSYPMNCSICHVREVGQWVQPSGTMMYMEGQLGLNDYSGQVGPVWVSRSLVTRHNQRGNVLYGDLHQERLAAPAFETQSKTDRFWYPTDDPTLRKRY